MCPGGDAILLQLLQLRHGLLLLWHGAVCRLQKVLHWVFAGPGMQGHARALRNIAATAACQPHAHVLGCACAHMHALIHPDLVPGVVGVTLVLLSSPKAD